VEEELTVVKLALLGVLAAAADKMLTPPEVRVLLGKVMREVLLLLVKPMLVLVVVAQEPLVVQHMVEVIIQMGALVVRVLRQAFLERPHTMLGAGVGQRTQAVQLGHPEVLAVLVVVAMVLIKPLTMQLLALLTQAVAEVVQVKFLLFLALVVQVLSSSATLARNAEQAEP